VARSIAIPLRTSDYLALIGSSKPWWPLSAIRTLLGVQAAAAKPLGYYAGPDRKRPAIAFAAFDVTQAYDQRAALDVKRSFALLGTTLITFDYVVAAEPCESRWILEGLEGTGIDVSRVQSPVKAALDTQHLNVLQLPGGERPRARVEEISTIDLAGVRMGDWIVLFNADNHSAASGVYFAVEGEHDVKCLLTGLAPGRWEIWRNGWREDSGGDVERDAGAFYFEGKPGSYFFRRLS